eukprot:5191905-Heterocapsa_arctica.AAC.1
MFASMKAVQKGKAKQFIVPGKFISRTKCQCRSPKTRSSKSMCCVTPRANGRGQAFTRTNRPSESEGIPRPRGQGAIPSNN